MELKKIIIVIIAILIIALAGVGLYVFNNGAPDDIKKIPEKLNINPEKAANVTVDNKTANVTNATQTNATNTTNATDKVVGDNSPRENSTVKNNGTYKVYNPQTDKYVPVIGEKYDEEVHRWYTYDTDGVRYYNTRIN